MASWSVALAVAVLTTIFVVPATRAMAFERGWFERSSETRRSRADRRPTHGGVVAGIAVVVAGAVGGPTEPALRPAIAALVIGLVVARSAERGRATAGLLRVARLAAAASVPVLGVRAELTGTVAIDAVLTALGALALIHGLDSVEQSDGVAPTIGAVTSLGLLVLAVRADDPSAPVFAALAGAFVGLVAHSWPPAAVRFGRVGPIVLGTALAGAAVELTPETNAPRSALVPVLALALLGLCALIPRTDRRLRRRGFQPHLLLPGAAAFGAVAANQLTTGGLEPVAAAALALIPVALVGAVAIVTSVPAQPVEDDVAGPQGDPAAPVAARNRTPLLLGLGALGAVLVVGAALSAGALRSARQAMETGRDAAVEGLDAARAGDLATAQARFEVADREFSSAKDDLGSPFVRLGDLVPGVAQNLRGARTLADVGGDLASTAVAVAEQAGADDLRVVAGQFPVDLAVEVGEELERATAKLTESADRLLDIDSGYLYPDLRDGAALVAQRVAEATRSLEVATQATRVVPELLGADGDRRFILAVMASSELRGAGGLLGDFAELRTSNGRIELVRSIAASELNAATDQEKQAEVLPPIYAERYGGYFPEKFWQNLSVTPDVATMSSAIAAAYPLTEGGEGPVDGVIAIDPVGIAALLGFTGPVRVPTWPVPITADNAAEILMFDHYDQIADADTRDAFQAEVVAAVVSALQSAELPTPSVLANALAPAVAGGHLRLWSPDDDAQALFRRLGIDGELRAPGNSDFVQLVVQNGSEAKIDWYLRRSLTYEANLDPATGALQATAVVTLTNGAPASGVDAYVIGEPGGPTQPGVSRLFSTIYTRHLPATVTDGAGNPLPVSLAQENGFYAITVLLEIPPGGTSTIRYGLEGVVQPGGHYRLDVGRQASFWPDRVELVVTTPEQWVPVSPPDGRVASELSAPASYDVTFSDTRP